MDFQVGVTGAISGFVFDTITWTGGQQLDGQTADVMRLIRGGAGDVRYEPGGAYPLNIVTGDGGRIGNRTGAGEPDADYIIFDRSNARISLWRTNTEKVRIGGAIEFTASIRPLTDAAGNCGTITNRFEAVIGRDEVGISDLTRMRAFFNATYDMALVNAANNITQSLQNDGSRRQDIAAVGAGTAYEVVQMYNRTGGATVVGYIYKGIHPVIADSVQAIVAIGDVYTLNAWPIWIAMEAVANTQLCRFAPLKIGQIVYMWSRTATGIGNAMDICTAPAPGTIEDSGGVAFTPGLSVGYAMETIGAPGLVKVYCCPSGI